MLDGASPVGMRAGAASEDSDGGGLAQTSSSAVFLFPGAPSPTLQDKVQYLNLLGVQIHRKLIVLDYCLVFTTR